MVHRERRLSALLLVLSLMVSAGASSALSQTPATDSLDQLLSDRLVLYALQYLQGDGGVADFQYTMADVLFEQAIALTPESADIWRLRADLAAGLGDRSLRAASLRKLIRLEPQDDASRLDLVYLLLDDIQTLDGRLDRVERMLTATGSQQLSAPLRSRLAVYAAAAAREMGDEQRFGAWLKRAMEWDEANDSAFRMALDYAIERESSVLTLAAITMKLVASAPMDQGARIELGTLFLREGAYGNAIQQIMLASQLSTRPLPPELVGSVIVSMMASGDLIGAEALLDRMRVTYFAGPEDEEGNPTPGPLPLPLEVLRLVMLSDREDGAEEAASVYAQIALALRERGTRESLADLGRITAMIGPDSVNRLQLADELAASAPMIAELLRLTVELREENPDLDQINRRLIVIAADEAMARLLLASMPQTSDERARQLYARAVADGPEELPAILAGVLHLQRYNEVVSPTRSGRRMVEMLDGYPSRLWSLDNNFQAWTDVDLRLLGGGSYDLLDPMPATLRVANLTSLPMTLGGSGGTISDVVMINLTVSVMGRPYAQLPPVIVDIDRPLTLGPGRAVEVPVNFRQSMLAGITADNPFTTIFVDLNAVLDPRPTRFGGIASGPLGAADALRGVSVRCPPPTQERLDEWITGMNNLETKDEVLAGLRVMGSATQGLIRGLNEDSVGRAAGELIQAYLRAGPKAQTYLIMAMPPVERNNTLLMTMLDDAAASSSPMVHMGYLLRHVGDPDHPALIEATDSSDATLRVFAGSYQSFLRTAVALREEQGQQAPQTGGFIGLPTPEELLRPVSADDPFAVREPDDEQE
ncbi:MAG: hypothetical protein RLN76_00170 [Phycisphaeraceae bacterium]